MGTMDKLSSQFDPFSLPVSSLFGHCAVRGASFDGPGDVARRRPDLLTVNSAAMERGDRTNPDLSPALNTEISLSEIDLEQSKHSGFIEKLQK